jgi:hypothetical protein
LAQQFNSGLGRLVLRFLDHRQDTHKLLCSIDQPVAKAAIHTTQQTREKEKTLPLAEIESAIPTIKRLETKALDFTSTGIGIF